MEETWDDYADDWDDNPDVVKYSELAYKSLLDFIDLKDKKVLDFGCGTGLLSQKIAKEASSVLALDTSSKMIKILEDKDISNITTLNYELSQDAIKKHPILQSKYDLILASSVCAFIPNFEDTLKTIKSLLTPDGLFIQWDWQSSEDEPDFGFDEKTIKEIYKRCDLSLVDISTPFIMESQNKSMKVIMAIGKNI